MEPDYVDFFWNQRTPKQTVGRVKIYLVRDEKYEFPELLGKDQIFLQECQEGIVEIS
jgi:hypothetical protein